MLSKLPPAVRAAAVSSAMLTVTLWVSVGAAVAAPATSPVNLAPWLGPDYARDPGAPFEPVSLELVSELFGEEAVPARLLLPPGGPFTLQGPQAPTPGSHRTDAQTPAEPGEEAAPPPPPPGENKAVLVTTMTSDRRSVGQAEEIHYEITVWNVGGVAATNVAVRTHVPQGTTQVSGSECDGRTVNFTPDGDGSIVCVAAENLLPPQAWSGEHIMTLYTTIPAHQHRIWPLTVRVGEETPDGTVIRNHAHAEADPPTRPDDSEDVWVVVE